ncbi:MAG TPA: hypothetical protein VGM05_13925 [Planctomycetaceae bacterium]
MSKQECVLVVDEISDTTAVLQAVLEPRGVAVNRIRNLGGSAAGNAAPRPSVVVLDAESLSGSTPPFGDDWKNIPQVIIGTIHVAEMATIDDPSAVPLRRYFQKPFQFAELVQAIESLIAPSAALR